MDKDNMNLKKIENHKRTGIRINGRNSGMRLLLRI